MGLGATSADFKGSSEPVPLDCTMRQSRAQSTERINQTGREQPVTLNLLKAAMAQLANELYNNMTAKLSDCGRVMVG